jgi:hypothetical protein
VGTSPKLPTRTMKSLACRKGFETRLGQVAKGINPRRRGYGLRLRMIANAAKRAGPGRLGRTRDWLLVCRSRQNPETPSVDSSSYIKSIAQARWAAVGLLLLLRA